MKKFTNFLSPLKEQLVLQFITNFKVQNQQHVWKYMVFTEQGLKSKLKLSDKCSGVKTTIFATEMLWSRSVKQKKYK